MLEPIQWLGKDAINGEVASTHAGTKAGGVAFVRGARAFYGSLKFKLCLAHVNNNSIGNDAANTDGGRQEELMAHMLGSSMPIMVRMCVIRLKGKVSTHHTVCVHKHKYLLFSSLGR
jgi:hypothetical protein